MRLVTRGDVDGLMCAVLLKAAGVIDGFIQAHPKDVQDGKIEVDSNDILCNLPYVAGCGMWFDHHSSEETADRLPESFVGSYAIAPSAARLVYDYYIGDHPELSRFDATLEVVDRFDSAQLTREDITDPDPAMLLCFVVDPRTGLGYHRSYRISNKQMTDMLPDLMLSHSAAEILEMPDIRERVDRYHDLNAQASEIYRKRSRVDGNIYVTDLRDLDEIPPANRFQVYTFPEAQDTNISVRLSSIKRLGKTSIQVGHNILNRTSKTNVGALMREHGGGGHQGAGTCQVDAEGADQVLGEILGRIRES